MNKILILYEHLASWCLSVCKKGNLRCVYCAAPYPSGDLSVVLGLSSVRMGQLCWKNSSFDQGYIEATSFQRKDPPLMHKCQFFVSHLGKKEWLLAKGNLLFVFSCVLTDTNYQKMEPKRLRSFCKQTKLHWSSWRYAPSFAEGLWLRHRSNTYTQVTGCKSPSVITIIMRNPTEAKQPTHWSNTVTVSK